MRNLWVDAPACCLPCKGKVRATEREGPRTAPDRETWAFLRRIAATHWSHRGYAVRTPARPALRAVACAGSAPRGVLFELRRGDELPDVRDERDLDAAILGTRRDIGVR